MFTHRNLIVKDNQLLLIFFFLNSPDPLAIIIPNLYGPCGKLQLARLQCAMCKPGGRSTPPSHLHQVFQHRISSVFAPWCLTNVDVFVLDRILVTNPLLVFCLVMLFPNLFTANTLLRIILPPS